MMFEIPEATTSLQTLGDAPHRTSNHSMLPYSPRNASALDYGQMLMMLREAAVVCFT
jgi:hypothetical protein